MEYDHTFDTSPSDTAKRKEQHKKETGVYNKAVQNLNNTNKEKGLFARRKSVLLSETGDDLKVVIERDNMIVGFVDAMDSDGSDDSESDEEVLPQRKRGQKRGRSKSPKTLKKVCKNLYFITSGVNHDIMSISRCIFFFRNRISLKWQVKTGRRECTGSPKALNGNYLPSKVQAGIKGLCRQPLTATSLTLAQTIARLARGAGGTGVLIQEIVREKGVLRLLIGRITSGVPVAQAPLRLLALTTVSE